MGFLDKLLGRTKSMGDESGSSTGREGARGTEPAPASAEGTRPTEPDAERRDGSGQEHGPS